MFKLLFILLISFIVFAFSDLLDVVGKFKFSKTPDASGEYNFEYNTENGEIFRGKTIALIGCDTHVHIMFGANDSMFWAQFDENVDKSKSVFQKDVRKVERTNSKLYFKDDLIEYTIEDPSSRWNEVTIIQKIPYLTLWDFKNICLTKVDDDSGTFYFEMRSKNNPRVYNGTTVWEKGLPLLQRIHLKDVQYDSIYEIEITESDLASNVTFCKGITKTIMETAVLGACADTVNNTKLMNELKKITGIENVE